MEENGKETYDYQGIANVARHRWESMPFPWEGLAQSRAPNAAGLIFFILCIPLYLFAGLALAALLLYAVTPTSWMKLIFHHLFFPLGILLSLPFARGIWEQEVALLNKSEDVNAWKDHAILSMRSQQRRLNYQDVRRLGHCENIIYTSDKKAYSLLSLSWQAQRALIWLYILPSCTPSIITQIQSGKPLIITEYSLSSMPFIGTGVIITIAGLLYKLNPLISILFVGIISIIIFLRRRFAAPPIIIQREGIRVGARPPIPWQDIIVKDVTPSQIILSHGNSQDRIVIYSHQSNFLIAAYVLCRFLPQIDLSPIAASQLDLESIVDDEDSEDYD